MFKHLAAAAALTLMTVGAAMAQTPGSNCAPGSSTPGTSTSGARANTTPTQGTCETIVQPNGSATTQNGPSTTAPTVGDAAHEGGTGAAGGSASGGAAAAK